jgi:hypothetical protein
VRAANPVGRDVGSLRSSKGAADCRHLVNLLAVPRGVRERLESLCRARGRTENVLEVERVTQGESRDESLYFANPEAQLLHLFLTIERYRKDQERARQALGFSRARYAELLALLERLGLISVTGKSCRVLCKTLHLSKDADLYPAYRVLMRLKALDRLRACSGKEEESYAYSVLFSANARVRKQIHEYFMEFLERAQQLVRKCESIDEVYQLDFDLLTWSGE